MNTLMPLLHNYTHWSFRRPACTPIISEYVNQIQLIVLSCSSPSSSILSSIVLLFCHSALVHHIEQALIYMLTSSLLQCYVTETHFFLFITTLVNPFSAEFKKMLWVKKNICVNIIFCVIKMSVKCRFNVWDYSHLQATVVFALTSPNAPIIHFIIEQND